MDLIPTSGPKGRYITAQVGALAEAWEPIDIKEEACKVGITTQDIMPALQA